MSDHRDQLVQPDSKLDQAWARVKIVLGLLAAAIGLFVSLEWFLSPKKHTTVAIGASGLILFGGYLTLKGFLCRNYISLSRETVTKLDELEPNKDRNNR